MKKAIGKMDTNDGIRYFNESDIDKYKADALMECYDWSKRVEFGSSTFLSHSSKDYASILPAAIGILKRNGANVYIDANDPSLLQLSLTETAMMLRDRINECKRFIVLVSENSYKSLWIPWELGYADGRKDELDIAIFPYVPTHSAVEWLGQEYLGCYARICRDNNEWVVYSKNRGNPYMILREWLKRR